MKLFKRVMLAVSMLGVMALPFSAVNAATVTIESTTNVANQTAGDTQYKSAATAKVDDVVKVQVWYHNREEADSGLVANNLKVQVNIPSSGGAISGTASSDNSNTVTTSANVTLPAGSHLEYIPGTAYWRHNTGDNTNVNYVTQKISDNVVNGGVVLENLKPCFNFEATVTVEARVVASAVSIQKLVRVHGSGADYTVTDSANPGDTLDYVLKVKNDGNTTLHGVVVGDNMPPYLSYVPGSTLMVDSNTSSSGMKMPDGITTGGITVDDLGVGGGELIYFQLKLADSIPCGNHGLENVGIVKAQGVTEVYNVATTNVNVTCQTPPPVTPPVTPPTPTSPNLPQTGMEGAAGMVGTGALGYAVQTWRRSKQSLASAMRKLGR